MRHFRLSAFLAGLAILSAPLAAQTGTKSRLGGFSIFASMGQTSGSRFPSQFEKLNSVFSFHSAEAKARGKAGDFTLGLGFLNPSGIFLAGFEASYTRVAFPDAVEIEHFAGWDSSWNWTVIDKPFAQTDRRLALIELGFNGGILPFRRFPVAFMASLGLFHYNKTFRSGYVASLPPSVGLDTTTTDWYGQPDSDGRFSKSGIGVVFGTGLKLILSHRVSLDLLYKSYLGSRKTSSVVGGGPGTVIKAEGEEFIGLGNRLSAGLAFIF